MYQCNQCKIKINADTAPGKCPKCPNSNPEAFTELADTPEKIRRVCNRCENEVLVSDTTGECPYCNESGVFTEPEDEAPGLVAVGRYAGRTIKVDPDNVLSQDSEAGFQEFVENETPNATADTAAD